MKIKALFISLFLFFPALGWGIQSNLRLQSNHTSPQGKFRSDNPFRDTTVGLLNLNNSPVQEKLEINYEERNALLQKNAFGVALWTYYYPELEAYLEDCKRFSRENQIYGPRGASLRRSDAEKRGSLLEIEVPVKMPEWAKRFAGDEAPKLTLSLRRKIIFEGRSSWVPGENPPPGQRASRFPDLNFNQEGNINVRGTVGRLIDVQINQDTDAENLDQQLQDQVKIHYKGEGDELEDEIIQEVEAGNTQMSLPNTEFSGYSETHKGLFGIRMRAKVGDLDITTVASQEKGEGQKREFIIGQGEKRTEKIYDKNWLRNKYFFLDTVFAGAYRRGELPTRTVVEFMAFAHYANRNMQNLLQTETPQLRPRPVEVESGVWRDFQALEEDKDYYFNRDMGYIALNNVYLDDQGMLAVYYKTSSGEIFGDTTGFFNVRTDSITQKDMLHLLILKAAGQKPSDPTYDLMWKNVYSIGVIEQQDSRDIEIEILLKDTINHQQGKPYTYLLGIADSTGRLLSDNDSIFRFNRGELIFPPRDQVLEPFNNRAKLDTVNASIYETDYDADMHELYTLRIAAISKRADYDLGINVIRNSERIMLDGRTLESGKDYSINYESGKLTMITPDATPGRKVEAEYESESMFLAEQKIFMGSRVECKLPILGEGSFVGMSALYKSESISEKKAQVGREPYRKILLDANTKISTRPEWMTALVDAIPGIQTREKSSFNISGEVAMSLPNPNTKGEAMMDDFEGADVSYPLGVSQIEWHQSSPPGKMRPDTLVVGRLWWNNPEERVRQDTIWKDVETTTEDQRIDVLNLEFRPTMPDTSSWGGVMRALPMGGQDLSESKFFEITMKGDAGRLALDLGQMSEDLSLDGREPNNRLDTEDKLVDSRRNGILDPGEDLGVDGQANEDEIYYVPDSAQSSWRSLVYDPSLRPDPHSDDYNAENSRYWNGTEEDAQAGDTRRFPETEDINNSGYLDVIESCFRHSIDLSDTVSDSSYYVRGTAYNGWKLYRIPLRGHADTISSSGKKPDWRKIEFIRLVLSGFADSSKTQGVQIARMEFVGNLWREVKLADSSQATLEVSVVNTQKNVDYEPASWIVIERDPVSNTRLREQSLSLSFSDLQAGKLVMAKRALGEAVSLSNYSRIQFDLYGAESYASDSVFYFIRFSSDSSNYYEFRTPVRKGWAQFDLELADFSEIKRSYFSAHPQAQGCDTVAQNGLAVFGNPQYTNLKTLFMGVLRSAGASGSASGVVWVNELKLSGIRNNPGYAGRVSFNSRFADFLTVDGSAKYQDGNFVGLGQANRIGNGITSVDGRLSGSMTLDRFLQSRWGISVPLTASITGSVSRPRLQPNQDVLLGEDELKEMWRDVFNELAGKPLLESVHTPSSEFQSKKVDRTLGISYRKTTPSDNALVHLLADRSQTQYGFRQSCSSEPSRLDTNWNHSGDLNYDLSPRKRTEYRPFQKLELRHLPAFVKDFWINPLPTQLNFGVADVAYSHQKEVDRRLSTAYTTVRDVEKMDLNHDMRMSYAPINQVNLGLNVSVSRNFDQEIQRMRLGGASEAASRVFAWDNRWGDNMLLNQEIRRNQGVNADWSPNFVSWLTHQLGFNADYQHSLNSDRNMDMDVNSAARIGLGFMPVTFLSSAEKITRFAKPLSLSLKKVQEGLSSLSLNNVGANYTVSTKQSVRRLREIPLGKADLLLFQTGMLGRNLKQIFYDGRVDETTFGQVRYWEGDEYLAHKDDSRSVDRSLRLNTGIQLPLSTSLTGSSSWSKTLHFFNDTTRQNDSTLTFPEWELSANNSSFGNLPGFRRKVRNISVSTSYGYRKQSDYPATGERVGVEKRMNPLAEINVTWKNEVQSQLRRTWSKRDDWNSGDASTVTQRTVGDSFSISYRFSEEKPVRFLRWKSKFKNNLDAGFGFGHSSRKKSRQVKGENNDITEEDVENYNGGPSARYYFTDHVDGGADLNYGSTRDKAKADRIEKSILVRIWAEIRF